MIAKRKEFIDRLLRISQLNEELIHLGGDKNRQPAFTRRIRLVQMGKAELNLPVNQSLVPQTNHNCKILVIDKRPQRYQTSADSRNKTPNLKVQHTDSLQTSPQKTEPENIRFLLEKKKSINTLNQHANDDISFVIPVKFETKRFEGSQSQNQNKRCNLLSKKMASQPKYLGYTHSSQVRGFFGMDAQKTGYTSGIMSKGHQRPCTATYDKDKKIESARKAKLISMKQINKNYAKPFIPPPRISAKSYIIGEVQQEGIRVVVAYNSKNSQEIASLTKIMTCILTIELCQKQKFDIDKEDVKIGRYQTNIGGTTADLKIGQIYTIKQLLYGLMLPSGNDASLALAVWSGRKYLQLYPQYEKDSKQSTQCSSKTSLSPLMNKYTKGGCYARFVRQMNEKAKQLNMVKTKYVNSHGLSNQNNRSTSYDICLLCNYAIKNTLFRQIVSCKSFETIIRFEKENQKGKLPIQMNCIRQDLEIDQIIEDSRSPNNYKKTNGLVQSIVNQGINKQGGETTINTMGVRWQNTHKLLLNKPDEYLGIKTGTTTTAGPCLSSLIRINNRQFLIIVLACSKLSFRFKQTQILKKWLYKNEGITKKIKRNNIQIENPKQSSESEQDQDKLTD